MIYSNWDQGQPDYSNDNEACMSMSGRRGFKWQDSVCSNIFCFVCEIAYFYLY